ncbi:tetratricopeptide repeat-containing diguanylate cyclase [Massilia sp. DD77]|uniref:tetratricopeptide repeat-containing diguanylate cyclase n=1 Tax=Massilia sp. DD77 TaxID=3109349 RepID=UPI002FFF6CD5
MPHSLRLASCLLLSALLLGAASLRAAPMDSAAAQAELAAIHKLSQRSPTEALGRLASLQAATGENAPYALRQELLRTEVWLNEDAGRLEQAYTAERKVLALALAHKDRATAARARLGEVRRMLDQNRPDDAQARLDAILAEAPADAPAMLKVSLDTTQGDISNAKAHYDKALAAYLGALRMLDSLPDSADHRSLLRGRIAQIYINNDHPEKAVEATRLGLADPGVPAPAVAQLQYTQGIALIRLERNEEGIAAFEQALRGAQQAGLAIMEASVRGNIADYYLRRHAYPRAEQEARKALEASNRVKDQNLIVMAKANLGFALMGQGRLKEGAAHIDAVAAQLREAGASADLEAVLDEKGRMLEQAGQYRQALATVREQQALQQRSARTSRDRAIAALQEEFDASQRTREILLLKRENHLKDAELGSRRTAQLATSFAAVLTVLAGAVVYVLYRRAARSNARLQQVNTQLEYHSMRDSLTGLHNRRSFLEKMRARAELGKQERRGQAAGGVDCFVLMDIDHFKSINDRWGHGVGDAVLVEVARRLGAAVRDSDMVLRWGGEEFMIYAPGADQEHVAALVRRVLDTIGSAPVEAETCQVPVTVSAGVVWLPLPGAGEDLDWQRAIRLADWALYQGKAQGRNQARILTRLHAPAGEVLAQLEGAKDAAAEGLVELERVDGPPRVGS